jgi:hypothetical protein
MYTPRPIHRYITCYETTRADKTPAHCVFGAWSSILGYVAATALPFYVIQLVIFQQQHSYSSDQLGGKILPPIQGHACTTPRRTEAKSEPQLRKYMLACQTNAQRRPFISASRTSYPPPQALISHTCELDQICQYTFLCPLLRLHLQGIKDALLGGKYLGRNTAFSGGVIGV